MPAILRVAVAVPLIQIFDYLPPAGRLVNHVSRGCRVLVPFGRGRRVGVVIESAVQSDVPTAQLKSVIAQLDPAPLLTAELLDALIWTARYYQYPLGEVLQAALPVGLRTARGALEGGEQGFALTAVPEPALQRKPRAGTRTARLLDLLRDGPLAASRLDEVLPGWRGAAAALKRRGLIEPVRLKLRAAPRALIGGPVLNVEQSSAVEAIAANWGTFAPIVLEGITGSGKTEVYLRLIEQVLARGEQALVLVPEIGLTPQTLRRFRERLPVPIAVLHSGLSDGERTRAWLAAARGDVNVILGTRSAVFVPLPRAGLIVVDEEHDGSYKQHEGLRYSARDLGIVRAHALRVPIVLGSATPSLETLANVESGRYRSVRLGSRAGAARLPQFHCIDLRGKPLRDGLAQELIQALRACLARGEQALVFRNRRGYAPVLHCHACGWHAACARCDKPLTWHRGADRLRCHHCGAEQRVPEQCPQCGNVHLAPVGLGTERLEHTLAGLFPQVPIVRIDRETTRRKNGLEDLLARLPPDQPGLLIGTQMLAKGHDLPNLTTVAIVGVDEGLFSVDFRASERLSQLVVQVSGRAGRALKPGAVWLQTHHPDHPLLQLLLRDGYRVAARELLAERRATGLPPFAHLALLRGESSSLAQLEAFLARVHALAGAPGGVSVLGPMPAPMPRRAGLHRGQLLFSAEERARLQAFLPGWLALVRAAPEARRVRWSLDVDPLDLY